MDILLLELEFPKDAMSIDIFLYLDGDVEGLDAESDRLLKSLVSVSDLFLVFPEETPEEAVEAVSGCIVVCKQSLLIPWSPF